MRHGPRHYINNPGPKRTVSGVKAAASADHAIVVETMLDIMKAGGNAADAAIAGCLVQAAIEPFMTNHTGSITMLYWHAAEQKLYCLDSAGTFPKGLAPFKPVPPNTGPYARGAMTPSACIPGFMPGIKEIYQTFGSLPFGRLCADAARWAAEGHEVSSFEYELTTWQSEFATYFPEGRRFYMPDGHYVPVGGIAAYPEMARTLEKVAEHGPDWMISGGWAQAFVRKANAMGWAITMEHMTDATPPRWSEPHRYAYKGMEVASLAPPQVQGVFQNIVLGITQALDLGSVEPMSAEHIYFMSAALAKGNAMFGYCNDPRAFDNAIEVFSDPAWHATEARLIKSLMPGRDMSDHARFSGKVGAQGMMSLVAAGVPSTSSHQDQPSGSCELSIVDAHGNWCQMMNTLQSGGIPAMVVEGIPMVGSHATFGTHGSPIDTWLGEGLRMRSIIGNTMVFRDGQPVFQLGSPGNVHCTVPQVLSYWADYGMSPYDAASMPRMLPLSSDGTVVIEDRVPDATQHALRKMGLGLKVVPPWDYHMGSFQMCYRDRATGELCATADQRRCGIADGF